MLRPRLPDTPFTTRDALANGFTRNELTALVSEGLLRRPFTGVYVRADLPDSVALRAAAARLVMSPHSVLCDRTAAWLHGVDVFRYAELETVPVLDSYVLRGHDPTDRRECHRGTRDLLPEDWQLVAGVRVTTPLRTAVDLACALRRREALAAMDALARACGVTVSEINVLLRRYRRRRGVIQARELVQLVDPRSESSGESWSRLEIHDHDLPALEPQFWVSINGVPTYRLDLAYRMLGSSWSTTARISTPAKPIETVTKHVVNGYGGTGGTSPSSPRIPSPTRRCAPGRQNCGACCGTAA